MPRVAHTTATFGFRPVAKAFGMSVSATATRGLRDVRKCTQPIDHPVELRLLLGSHHMGVHPEEGDLVREPVLAEEERGRDGDHEVDREPDGFEDESETRRRG